MDILEYNHEKHIATIHPSMVNIKEFSLLMKRDTSRKKRIAVKELAYIWNMVRHDSPYISFEEELRNKKVIIDIFNNIEWEPDTFVKDAIAKYRELYESPMVRLLKGALIAIEKTARYYEDIDYSIVDDKGSLKYDPSKVIQSMSKLGDMVRTVTKLKEDVEKEMSGRGQLYGGVEINPWND